MAERNPRTKTEYTGERDEERSERCLEEKQTSKNGDNNPNTNNTFTVQNYRDYNVYSDIENVLNLNPVSYIDDVRALRNAENKEVTDKTDDQESSTKSLTTNVDNGRDKPSSIATSINTASHIISPATASKRSVAVRRVPRRDDSEQNYYDDLALNEDTSSLFGGHKTARSSSVIKCLSAQLFCTYLLSYMLT